MRKIIAVLGLLCVMSLGNSPVGSAMSGGEELRLKPEATNDIVAITNARILTVTKGVIEKGTVLVANGKILEVGAEVTVPAGARVIDGAGCVVTPGLIDSHSHLGLGPSGGVTEDNETTDPVTPQLRVIDSIHPEGSGPDKGQFRNALSEGVTTVIARPGSGNVIGGQSAVLKLRSGTVDDMIVSFPADMKMALGRKGAYASKGVMPVTKMGTAYLVRQAMLDAAGYRDALARYAGEKGKKPDAAPPARDLKKEAMLKVLEREIPVHIHVSAADDIMTAVRLADEFKFFKLSLGHAEEAYKVADELAKRGVVVVVGPLMITYDDEGRLVNLADYLVKRGVEVNIMTDADVVQEQFLRYQAAVAVKHGMDPAEALKAITINPARLTGLEKRIGSIEAGKDADLVVFSGDPFDIQSRTFKVMIDGRVVFEAKGAKSPQDPPLGKGGDNSGIQPKPAAGVEDPPLCKRGDRGDLPGKGGNRTFAIKGGRVLPMSGPAIEDGVVIVENGKISRVGKDIPVPEGATVIDAAGGWVLPGLIEAHTTTGLREEYGPSNSDELSDPVTAQLVVLDALNPFDKSLKHAREAGITAALVTPGRGNVIGGQAAVVRLAGKTVEEMTILAPAGLKLSLGEGPKDAYGGKGRLPSTRMGSAYVVRKALLEAGEYLKRSKNYAAGQAKAKGKAKAGKAGEEAQAPKRDLALEPLAALLDGKLPAFIECYRADDIMTALRLVDEFKFKAVLVGCAEGFRVAGEIAKRGIPVIVGPMGIGPKRVETMEVTIANAAALSKAGVKVVLEAEEDSLGVGALEELPLAAALAVKGGMDRDAALKAITMTAAEVLGVADRIGSLEAGKDADVVVFDGDPLDYRTRVKTVLLKGQILTD